MHYRIFVVTLVLGAASLMGCNNEDTNKINRARLVLPENIEEELKKGSTCIASMEDGKPVSYLCKPGTPSVEGVGSSDKAVDPPAPLTPIKDLTDQQIVDIEEAQYGRPMGYAAYLWKWEQMKHHFKNLGQYTDWVQKVKREGERREQLKEAQKNCRRFKASQDLRNRAKAFWCTKKRKPICGLLLSFEDRHGSYTYIGDAQRFMGWGKGRWKGHEFTWFVHFDQSAIIELVWKGKHAQGEKFEEEVVGPLQEAVAKRLSNKENATDWTDSSTLSSIANARLPVYDTKGRKYSVKDGDPKLFTQFLVRAMRKAGVKRPRVIEHIKVGDWAGRPDDLHEELYNKLYKVDVSECKAPDKLFYEPWEEVVYNKIHPSPHANY